MDDVNYDHSKIERDWCELQRGIVTEYLKSQKVAHGRIGEIPAWHFAPYVAVWAIESGVSPGWIGWWAISGDLPTDYVSSADIVPPQHPRKALRAISDRWKTMVDAWKSGQELKGIHFSGDHRPAELSPLLEARAQLLSEFADDDMIWEGL